LIVTQNRNIYKGLTPYPYMKDKNIDDTTIQCECGKIVKGISRDHTIKNLGIHKQSKEHKRNMKVLR